MYICSFSTKFLCHFCSGISLPTMAKQYERASCESLTFMSTCQSDYSAEFDVVSIFEMAWRSCRFRVWWRHSFKKIEIYLQTKLQRDVTEFHPKLTAVDYDVTSGVLANLELWERSEVLFPSFTLYSCHLSSPSLPSFLLPSPLLLYLVAIISIIFLRINLP